MSWRDDGLEWDFTGAEFAAGGALPADERDPDRQDRLIPLINIVFLLLAFMLLAGTFRAADTLSVEPPQAGTSGTIDRQSLVLYLDSSGNMALGKDRLGADEAISRAKIQL